MDTNIRAKEESFTVIERGSELEHLLGRIGTDLSILLREAELNRGLIEEVRGQVSVIRQVIDYVLFASPDKAQDLSELYPLSLWLYDQFVKIENRVTETFGAEGRANELKDVMSLQLAIQDELADLRASLNSRLEELRSEIAKANEPIELVEPLEGTEVVDPVILRLDAIEEELRTKLNRASWQKSLFYSVMFLFILLNLGLEVALVFR